MAAAQKRHYEAQIKKLRGEVKRLRSMVPDRFGRPGSGAPTTIRTSMYVGTTDAVLTLRAYTGVERLLKQLGASSTEAYMISAGSVWARIKATFGRFATDAETLKLADQIVQTAEAMTVDKAHAENAAVQLSSIAEVVQAGSAAGSIAIDLGALQYAQYTDANGATHITVRSISSREIAENRVKESLLSNPEAMHEHIASQPGAISRLVPAPSDE